MVVVAIISPCIQFSTHISTITKLKNFFFVSRGQLVPPWQPNIGL